MKKITIFLIIVAGVLAAGFWYKYRSVPQPAEKVYVAVEGESKIVALDPATNRIISAIDLSVEHEGGRLPYAPHNVQVSPDMETVWVTANVGKHQEHALHIAPYAYAHGEEEGGEDSDEVIVINPRTDKIIKRIPVGTGLHLAHVVLTPDSSLALVTAQNGGAVYKINTRTYEIEKRIAAPEKSEPHGIRIAPDGSTAYIAILAGKSLGVLDLKTDNLSTIPLGGAAVQAGVTPDGTLAMASLYDTKQLAVYHVANKALRYVALPEGAKGPIQMYPTPDSRFVYLADQGYYFGEPESDKVYKIDLWDIVWPWQDATGEPPPLPKEIKAGRAPHGVVVSPDGKFVYVTNLLSGDVSIISTATDEEIGRIKVGKEPNGISVWVK